jgi:hypothetical protein
VQEWKGKEVVLGRRLWKTCLLQLAVGKLGNRRREEVRVGRKRRRERNERMLIMIGESTGDGVKAMWIGCSEVPTGSMNAWKGVRVLHNLLLNGRRPREWGCIKLSTDTELDKY